MIRGVVAMVKSPVLCHFFTQVFRYHEMINQGSHAARLVLVKAYLASASDRSSLLDLSRSQC
jgi:hypothetical protein